MQYRLQGGRGYKILYYYLILLKYPAPLIFTKNSEKAKEPNEITLIVVCQDKYSGPKKRMVQYHPLVWRDSHVTMLSFMETRLSSLLRC